MKLIIILLIIISLSSCGIATTDEELTKIPKELRYKIASEIQRNEAKIIKVQNLRIKEIKAVSLPYAEKKFKATVDLCCFDPKTGRAEILLDENIIGKYNNNNNGVTVVAKYTSDHCNVF